MIEDSAWLRRQPRVWTAARGLEGSELFIDKAFRGVFEGGKGNPVRRRRKAGALKIQNSKVKIQD
jgi:hypothetical protein